MFQLKPLTRQGLEGALIKAERYRLLNEPWEAESICRDVLEVDAENQEAIVGLVLALSDQFGTVGAEGFDEACTLIGRLKSEYQRAYYQGILCERRAKSCFERANLGCGYMAYDWYSKAMEWFDKAQALRPPENEEAALRWNTCARMMMKHPDIQPAPRDDTESMLE